MDIFNSVPGVVAYMVIVVYHIFSMMFHNITFYHLYGSVEYVSHSQETILTMTYTTLFLVQSMFGKTRCKFGFIFMLAATQAYVLFIAP